MGRARRATDPRDWGANGWATMATMITTTRTTLLEGLRGGGDPRAWQEFVRLYAPALMAFVKRLGLADADAADAVQETLIAVYMVFHDLPAPFDRTKGRFRSWLRAVAQHKVRDVQRRRARAGRAVGPEPLEAVAEQADRSEAQQAFELEWQRALLARALEQVIRETDPAVYQAFELYTLHSQPAGKVAKLLGTTRNAVYISKTRVLKRLRVVLAELIAEEG
jgi:RNA polymerase sigma-70 factor (ECF subfamily)